MRLALHCILPLTGLGTRLAKSGTGDGQRLAAVLAKGASELGGDIVSFKYTD